MYIKGTSCTLMMSINHAINPWHAYMWLVWQSPKLVLFSKQTWFRDSISTLWLLTTYSKKIKNEQWLMFATTLVPAHYLKKTKELLLLEREEEKSFVCLLLFFFVFYLYLYFFMLALNWMLYKRWLGNGNLPDNLWSRAQVIPETLAQCFMVTTSGVTLESIFA